MRVFKGANEVSMSGLKISGTKVKVNLQKRSEIFRDLIKFRDLVDGMKIRLFLNYAENVLTKSLGMLQAQ